MTGCELIPRATVEEIVALRNQSLKLYGDAWTMIASGRRRLPCVFGTRMTRYKVEFNTVDGVSVGQIEVDAVSANHARQIVKQDAHMRLDIIRVTPVGRGGKYRDERD